MLVHVCVCLSVCPSVCLMFGHVSGVTKMDTLRSSPINIYGNTSHTIFLISNVHSGLSEEEKWNKSHFPQLSPFMTGDETGDDANHGSDFLFFSNSLSSSFSILGET